MDAQQLTARARAFCMGEQRFAVPLLGHFGDSLEERIERAVGRNQIPCTLFADAWNAFDVVDGVTHQGEDVDDPVRRHADLLVDAGRVVPHSLVPRVENPDAVAHELEEILVAGDDGDAVAFGGGLLRQGSDDVVSLVAFVGQNRHAERFAGAMDQWDLTG